MIDSAGMYCQSIPLRWPTDWEHVRSCKMHSAMICRLGYWSTRGRRRSPGPASPTKGSVSHLRRRRPRPLCAATSSHRRSHSQLWGQLRLPVSRLLLLESAMLRVPSCLPSGRRQGLRSRRPESVPERCRSTCGCSRSLRSSSSGSSVWPRSVGKLSSWSRLFRHTWSHREDLGGNRVLPDNKRPTRQATIAVDVAPGSRMGRPSKPPQGGKAATPLSVLRRGRFSPRQRRSSLCGRT